MSSSSRKMINKEVYLTKNESTVLYLRHHPVFAAETLFNIKLNWLQRLALLSIWNKAFGMLVWGRRNGKTYTGAIASVLMCMLYPSENVLIVAPGKKQVDFIFLNEIIPLYQKSSYFRACVKGKVVVTNAYNRVVFTNGSRIEAFPVGADGGKARGANASFLWIDEFAQMSESVINMVFKPMLAVKRKNRFNRYLVTSSAYYRWNHLFTLFQYYKIKSITDPKNYFVYNFNYTHLLKSKHLPVDFDMNVVREQKETMTENEFAMEWLAVYPVDIEGFFSSQLINNSTPRPPDKEPVEIELVGDGKSDYYIGIDVGRMEGGSNFSISVVKLNKNIGRLVNIITANGATFQVMAEMIRRKFIDFNPRKIMLDAGGGGTTIRDLLREKWDDYVSHKAMAPIITADDMIKGYRVLEMVNITDEIHNQLHMNLKSEMEHSRFLLPIDLRRDVNKEIERVGNEIIAFKTEMQVMTAKPKGKYLRFEVPNKFRTDRVMSTALCMEGYLQVCRNYSDDDDDLPVGYWVNK